MGAGHLSHRRRPWVLAEMFVSPANIWGVEDSVVRLGEVLCHYTN